MRVLAVTLGRSSRPRHGDLQDVLQHQTQSPATRSKEDVTSLIHDHDHKHVMMYDDDEGVSGTGSLGRSGASRIPKAKTGPETSTGNNKMVTNQEQRLISVQPNVETKSAKVTRIPRETMSAHRSSKLVRNSSSATNHHHHLHYYLHHLHYHHVHICIVSDHLHLRPKTSQIHHTQPDQLVASAVKNLRNQMKDQQKCTASLEPPVKSSVSTHLPSHPSLTTTTTSSSDLVRRINVASGAHSHFGTFPRRRPSQK
ncbi:hypothetical protein Pmani_028713, partial [Petrolisthes manimaculis]